MYTFGGTLERLLLELWCLVIAMTGQTTLACLFLELVLIVFPPLLFCSASPFTMNGYSVYNLGSARVDVVGSSKTF